MKKLLEARFGKLDTICQASKSELTSLIHDRISWSVIGIGVDTTSSWSSIPDIYYDWISNHLLFNSAETSNFSLQSFAGRHLPPGLRPCKEFTTSLLWKAWSTFLHDLWSIYHNTKYNMSYEIFYIMLTIKTLIACKVLIYILPVISISILKLLLLYWQS